MTSRLLAVCFAPLALLRPASAVEFSSVEMGGKRFTVCRVNVRQERLQLFHRDETGQPFKRFGRLTRWVEARGQKVVFAMNAGMYHADLSPVGLLVAGGQQLAPLNTANADGNFYLKPNGVFVLTDAGARVVESSEYPKLRERVILATQSGPLLLRRGQLHPAFGAKAESRFIRNGVGVPSPGVAIFVITDAAVNFYEFAILFRDKLDCPDALYLDGSISSLHAPQLKRSDFLVELGPIIAVTQ
ncbi:MAG TPA: phosphodiester glycosidase family protein [Verrucomicrobiae bacterium]|nr:phosphodiester glycosidase family protein [Verrucomicrobiae bacterium]